MRVVFFLMVGVALIATGAIAEDVTTAAAVPAAATAAVANVPAQAATDVFNVFTEKWAKDNHFAASGWMGDYSDIKITDACAENPHSGKTCVKITYTAEGTQGAGWFGLFWQNPPNNWGDQMGGYDLSEYKKLKFWARGEKGGEMISEFKVGGIGGMYADSDTTSIDNITLTPEWKEYEIDLTGLDLSYISGGFELSASAASNPEGLTIYLDDIRFEK